MIAMTHMPLVPSQLAERLHACGAEIAQAGAEFAARGWTPATSSNFSMRIDGDTAAVTISGRDKGALTSADVMAVTLFRFTDSAYTKKGQVGFLAWMRSGGNLVDVGGAVKTFKHGAAS